MPHLGNLVAQFGDLASCALDQQEESIPSSSTALEIMRINSSSIWPEDSKWLANQSSDSEAAVDMGIITLFFWCSEEEMRL